MSHRRAAPPTPEQKARRRKIRRVLGYALAGWAVIGIARIAIHPREFMLALPQGPEPSTAVAFNARAAVLIQLEHDPQWLPRLPAAGFGAFSGGHGGAICGSIDDDSFVVPPGQVPLIFPAAPASAIRSYGCPLVGDAARVYLKG